MRRLLLSLLTASLLLAGVGCYTAGICDCDGYYGHLRYCPAYADHFAPGSGGCATCGGAGDGMVLANGN